MHVALYDCFAKLFWPATVAGSAGLPDDLLTDIVLAERLMETCYSMYSKTPLGLHPEKVKFTHASRGFRHSHQVLQGT